MYLGHMDCTDIPQPGDELFSADFPEQATGMIVNAAPAAMAGFDVLAVLQISSAAGHSMHLKSQQGSQLSLQTLPYSVPL